jgi:hypothetical protein
MSPTRISRLTSRLAPVTGDGTSNGALGACARPMTAAIGALGACARPMTAAIGALGACARPVAAAIGALGGAPAEPGSGRPRSGAMMVAIPTAGGTAPGRPPPALGASAVMVRCTMGAASATAARLPAGTGCATARAMGATCGAAASAGASAKGRCAVLLCARGDAAPGCSAGARARSGDVLDEGPATAARGAAGPGAGRSMSLKLDGEPAGATACPDEPTIVSCEPPGAAR